MITTGEHPSTSPAPRRDFSAAADADTIERTAEALRAGGFAVSIAADRDEARGLILALVPEGAEVHSGSSVTLDELGVTAEIERSGRYQALRPRLWSMDRELQGQEIRKLGAAPDVWLNSAHAVTEAGEIVIASATGSQLGPIASGAGRVILAIGAQKLVPDLSTGLRRIEEHSLPLEDARSRAAYGWPSGVNKVLILRREVMPGRTTVVLIREFIGY